MTRSSGLNASLRRGLRHCAAASIGAAAAASANAADGVSSLNQSVWLRVGAFHPGVDSNARVDHPQTGAPGTEIDLEDLGLAQKKTLPTLLLGARLGERWRVEFEYFRLSRSGRTTLGQLLNFDDTRFPVQASLDTRFKSEVYRATVGYSFVRTPQVEFGGDIGLHVTRFDLALDGAVTVAGVPVAVQSDAQRRTVPLPTLGLYGAYAFAPHWEATARLDVFSLKHGRYDGRLVNAQLNLIYRLTSNVGVGLGYRFDDYRIEATKPDFRGRIDYRFGGPQAFVEVGF